MYVRWIKRPLDIVVAVLALATLAPVFVVAAIAIKISDGGPVIFRQQRAGRAGRQFTIYKFRSMPVSTPSVPSTQLAGISITKVGRFLRRTNIDELPQLCNVILGDMSIVGPRPALSSQSSLLAARKHLGIDALRPGLTGLAQVNAYDGMPESEKLQWESSYARHVTFKNDLVIALRTLGYLMRRPPVY